MFIVYRFINCETSYDGFRMTRRRWTCNIAMCIELKLFISSFRFTRYRVYRICYYGNYHTQQQIEMFYMDLFVCYVQKVNGLGMELILKSPAMELF